MINRIRFNSARLFSRNFDKSVIGLKLYYLADIFSYCLFVLSLLFKSSYCYWLLDWPVALDKYARQSFGNRSTGESPESPGFSDKFVHAGSSTSASALQIELSHSILPSFQC